MNQEMTEAEIADQPRLAAIAKADHDAYEECASHYTKGFMMPGEVMKSRRGTGWWLALVLLGMAFGGLLADAWYPWAIVIAVAMMVIGWLGLK